MRIGHRAAERHVRDTRFLQLVRHPLQQPGADHAPPAVMDQDLFAAELPDQRRGLRLRTLAENHLGGRIVIESEHNVILLLLFSAFHDRCLAGCCLVCRS